MNKKIFFLLAAAIALLMSCSDSIKQDTNVETDAKLRVSAIDGPSGAPTAATAILLGDPAKKPEKSITTTAPAVFKVQTGSHRVRVSKTGYATAEIPVVIDITNTSNTAETHVARDRSVIVSLFPLTAKLTGILTYTDANGHEVPAAGVTVRVLFHNSTDLLVREATTTTKDDGSYAFDGDNLLPAVGTAYDLYALASKMPNGALFPEQLITTAVQPLLNEGSVDFSRVKLLPTSAIVTGKVLDAPDRVDAATDIEITFSDVVNTELVDQLTLVVSRPAIVTWSGSKLILKPVSGEWEPGNVNVTLTNLRFNRDNILTYYYKSITVNAVDLSEKKIEYFINQDSAKIHFNSESVVLRWHAVKGATGYELYCAQESLDGKGKGEFVEYATYGAITDSTTQTIYLSTCGIDRLADSVVVFKLLAKNGSSKTAFKELKVFNQNAPDFIANGAKVEETCKEWDDPDDPETSQVGCIPGVITPSHYKSYSSSLGGLINFYEYEDVKDNVTPDNFTTLKGLDTKLGDPSENGKVLTYGRIFFNKGMDTDPELLDVVVTNIASSPANPKQVTAAKAKARLVMSLSWANDRNLNITLKMGTGATNPLSELDFMDVIYSITGLKSKDGLPFKSYYGQSATSKNSKAVGTVNMRFKATVAAITPCTGTGMGSTECQEYCDNNPSVTACENKCLVYGYGTACDSYCDSNPNESMCWGQKCVSSLGGNATTSSVCGTFCKNTSITGTNRTNCASHWGCEMSGYGINSTACAKEQCGFDSETPTWGNNGFGAGQTVCALNNDACYYGLAGGPSSDVCETYCGTNPTLTYRPNSGVDYIGHVCVDNADNLAALETTTSKLGSVVYANYCGLVYEYASVPPSPSEGVCSRACVYFADNSQPCTDYCLSSSTNYLSEPLCANNSRKFCDGTNFDALCTDGDQGSDCTTDNTESGCVCDASNAASFPNDCP